MARFKWEHKCVTRARKGDRKAFAELYKAYAGPIYAQILLPRLGNQEAAEDALAETFRSALERLHQFQDQGRGIWPWLVRIATNKANDSHRKHARTGRALTSFQHLMAPITGEVELPESRAAHNQLQERLEKHVREVLTKINPRYRRAIELRFLCDRSRQGCADEMGVKLGTFDVLILRALRAFRKQWDTVVGVSPVEGK